MSGGSTFLLADRILNKIVLSLIAVAAVSLLDGALFHMPPEAVG